MLAQCEQSTKIPEKFANIPEKFAKSNAMQSKCEKPAGGKGTEAAGRAWGGEWQGYAFILPVLQLNSTKPSSNSEEGTVGVKEILP